MRERVSGACFLSFGENVSSLLRKARDRIREASHSPWSSADVLYVLIIFLPQNKLYTEKEDYFYCTYKIF